MKDTSIKKCILYSELRNVLPCRVGIEFELSGSFKQGFARKYKVSEPSDLLDNKIAEFYKVKEIRCDTPVYTYTRNYELSNPNEPTRVIVSNEPFDDEVIQGDPLTMEVDYDKLTEIRISLKDYSQLSGLYRFMQDLNEFCRLHEGGGIHIHIDMSMFKDFQNTKKEKEVFNYIRRRIDDIQKIFPKYKGKYNKKKIGLRTKATWLNISRLNTFEFRIAPLTFDYSTLIKWIHDCVKFRSDVIRHCRLKHNYHERVVQEVMKTLDTFLSDGRDEYQSSDWVVCSNDGNGTYTISTRGSGATSGSITSASNNCINSFPV
jgi:hypothetical protein